MPAGGWWWWKGNIFTVKSVGDKEFVAADCLNCTARRRCSGGGLFIFRILWQCRNLTKIEGRGRVRVLLLYFASSSSNQRAVCDSRLAETTTPEQHQQLVCFADCWLAEWPTKRMNEWMNCECLCYQVAGFCYQSWGERRRRRKGRNVVKLIGHLVRN